MKFIFTLLLFFGLNAHGELITYKDGKGTMHAVTSIDDVPKKYRAQVKSITSSSDERAASEVSVTPAFGDPAARKGGEQTKAAMCVGGKASSPAFTATCECFTAKLRTASPEVMRDVNADIPPEKQSPPTKSWIERALAECQR